MSSIGKAQYCPQCGTKFPDFDGDASDMKFYRWLENHSNTCDRKLAEQKAKDAEANAPKTGKVFKGTYTCGCPFYQVLPPTHCALHTEAGRRHYRPATCEEVEDLLPIAPVKAAHKKAEPRRSFKCDDIVVFVVDLPGALPKKGAVGFVDTVHENGQYDIYLPDHPRSHPVPEWKDGLTVNWHDIEEAPVAIATAYAKELDEFIKATSPKPPEDGHTPNEDEPKEDPEVIN